MNKAQKILVCLTILIACSILVFSFTPYFLQVLAGCLIVFAATMLGILFSLMWKILYDFLGERF